ncbi:hypothetical protein WM41_0306 [Corynebacterium simulans]|uniref:Uncharacterized protein n=1 Tax=Corynebacterium simulans TaxID=146827 RepID=A0ABR5VBD2_9CORY|nr:hypothetical protein WM41_0306 [Corynebacterium simulans]
MECPKRATAPRALRAPPQLLRIPLILHALQNEVKLLPSPRSQRHGGNNKARCTPAAHAASS